MTNKIRCSLPMLGGLMLILSGCQTLFAPEPRTLDSSTALLRCKQEFRRCLEDASCYHFGDSQRNIRNLIMRFQAAGIPLSEGRVGFVLYEIRQNDQGRFERGRIVPLRTILGRAQAAVSFDHHVFLEWGGRIFDPDFAVTPQDPRAYAKSMYGGEGTPEALSRLVIRELSTDDFVRIADRIRDTQKVVDYFRAEADSDLTVRTMTEYLEQFTPQ